MKIHKLRTKHYTGFRMGWMHAHKEGRAVLVEESSWRTINGFFIRGPKYGRWFLFRRGG